MATQPPVQHPDTPPGRCSISLSSVSEMEAQWVGSMKEEEPEQGNTRGRRGRTTLEYAVTLLSQFLF